MTSHNDINTLMEDYGIEPPKHWSKYSIRDKLDYIATRILAEDRRGKTSKQEILEEGYHSVAQEKRRFSHLVFFGNNSSAADERYNDYVENFFTKGVFSRTHVNNDLHTGE